MSLRYLIFGVAVLALVGTAEYRGWSTTSASETRASPRSVRDNPGSYRPVYVGGGSYPRGK